MMDVAKELDGAISRTDATTARSTSICFYGILKVEDKSMMMLELFSEEGRKIIGAERN